MNTVLVLGYKVAGVMLDSAVSNYPNLRYVQADAYRNVRMDAYLKKKGLE